MKLCEKVFTTTHVSCYHDVPRHSERRALEGPTGITQGDKTMGRWIRLFTERAAPRRELLCGRGATLAQMTWLGLPIPPALPVTTEACLEYLRHDGRIP